MPAILLFQVLVSENSRFSFTALKSRKDLDILYETVECFQDFASPHKQTKLSNHDM